MLLAFLNAGVGRHDEKPDESGWDNRLVEHVRINKDLPAAAPFNDEVREVLASLAAAQRADPFFRTVLGYVEIAGTSHAAP